MTSADIKAQIIETLQDFEQFKRDFQLKSAEEKLQWRTALVAGVEALDEGEAKDVIRVLMDDVCPAT